VCRTWRAAAAGSALWRAAFMRTFGPTAAAQLTRRTALGAPDWRAALVDRYRAGAAWRDGRCRSRTLEAANREACIFCIADDHLIACSMDGARARRTPRLSVHAAFRPAVLLAVLQARWTCAAWSGARAASAGPSACGCTRTW
jgi:hypothetical protein